MLMRRRKNSLCFNFGKISEAKKKLVRYGTVVRASVARELNPATDKWEEVEDNVARYVRDLPDATHGTHGLLSEYKREVAVTYSADFLNAAWAVTNAAKTDTALESVIAGKTATKFTATSAGGYVEQVFTGLPAQQAYLHAVVEANTAGTIQLELRKTAGSISKTLISFVFATGEITVVSGTASDVRVNAVKTHEVGPNNGAVWILMAVIPSEAEAVETDCVRLYPSASSGTNATIIHNLNLHDTAGFAPVVTGATTDNQHDDTITVAIPQPVVAETTGITICVRYRKYMSDGAADTHFVAATLTGTSAMGVIGLAGTEFQLVKRDNVTEGVASTVTEALMETRIRMLAYGDDELIELSGGAVTTNALDDHPMADQDSIMFGGFLRATIIEAVKVIRNKLPATSLAAYYS